MIYPFSGREEIQGCGLGFSDVNELMHISVHHHGLAQHELHLRNLTTLDTNHITSKIRDFFACIEF